MARWIAGAVVAVVLGCAAGSSAQTRTQTPRTPWGHPDLQGRWTNATLTPLERPMELGSKEFFTEVEAAEYAKTALDKLLAAMNLREEAALSGEFGPVWVEERGLVPTRRTATNSGSSNASREPIATR